MRVSVKGLDLWVKLRPDFPELSASTRGLPIAVGDERVFSQALLKTFTLIGYHAVNLVSTLLVHLSRMYPVLPLLLDRRAPI